MRSLTSLLCACLLACDVSANVTVTSIRADTGVTLEPTSVTLPTVEIVTRRVSRCVLIVGDSEACTVGTWNNATGIVRTINEENHEPYDDVHVACKGGTVIQYWGRDGHLAQAMKDYPNPDDVIVFLGTNHYWVQEIPWTSRVPNQLTLREISTVTDQLEDTHCTWVGNTAFRGKHWVVNGLIRDAVTPACTYFDTEAANIPLADEAHPGHAGAVKWLRLVWKTIPPKYDGAEHE